jgi:acyl-CoA reductase-like NAD-dependent aldehyde dehydrogenase
VMADAAHAELATVAALGAFEVMRRQSSFERKRVLQRVANAVASDAAAFAELIACEAGKPIALARAEVARAVATLELGAEEAARMGGEVLALDVSEASAHFSGGYTRVPAGPVIALSPFNFPLNLVCHKVAPALACGCPIVLKPAPQSPLSALKLAELVRQAGAAPNALQVLPCSNAVAEAMVRDPRFATLSFTGSAKVGWYLGSIAGNKRVLLELGGNAAMIVHEDAELSSAAERVVSSAFAYAGQTCIKGQRLLVHAPIYDRFVRDVLERASQLRVREPLDPEALMSSVIDESSAQRIAAWIEEAAQAGVSARLRPAIVGTRIPPTILELSASEHGDLRVATEEVFGPVLTVQRYEHWQDALTLANHTRYGLQAGIFTQHLGRVREAFERIEVGGLVVNDSPSFRVDAMPYGGVKDSGRGREGVRYAMEEMTYRKLLAIRG